MTRHIDTPRARSRFFAGLLCMVVIPAILLSAGCSGRHGTEVRNDEGSAGEPAAIGSSIRMGDAGVKGQLPQGFYGVEGGSWRWTAGKFSILLKTPPEAATHGGTLTFNFTVSDAVLKQVHSQTLTAAIGDKTLHSETYTSPGKYSFVADVPADLLKTDTVTVDFSLDHPLPPGPADARELGVIATAASLESN